MPQHGQVLKLRARRRDGKAVWAYRYRVNALGPSAGRSAGSQHAPRHSELFGASSSGCVRAGR